MEEKNTRKIVLFYLADIFVKTMSSEERNK